MSKVTLEVLVVPNFTLCLQTLVTRIRVSRRLIDICNDSSTCMQVSDGRAFLRANKLHDMILPLQFKFLVWLRDERGAANSIKTARGY